jgi:ankyrin repeat protein
MMSSRIVIFNCEYLSTFPWSVLTIFRFEAAWTGDLETIKELTLKPHEDQPPLKIAVQDDNLTSPFSIAVMRGHLEVADAILEICLAQFSPKEKKDNERYALAHEDEYDSDYDSYDSEAESEDVRILRKIVDDKFTVDNIGEISLKVDSHITPLEYLGWTTAIRASPDDDDKVKNLTDNSYLLEYAIAADNHRLFTWLLDLGRRYTTLKTENGITPSGTFYSPPTELLHKAILHGRTKMISELLKRTGNGIPFEDLVKKTGVKETESPRYYQGLSVYGKKRTDWAQAGRRAQTKVSTGSPISPLLVAAKAGTLESLEFLMSDTPVRLYHEFVAENKDDKRVKRLTQAEGGIEKAITDWYYANEESLISAAVSSRASADADRRLEYLIKAHPNYMDAKLADGESPLQLAFKLGRYSAAKILLDAGADPMSRDVSANNMIHKALQNFSIHNDDHKIEQLKAMLELLNEKTRSKLLLQRNTAASGGGTPVHNWLTSATDRPRQYYYYGDDGNDATKASRKTSDVLETLLSLSEGKELSLINGAGDTPLHGMIISRKLELVKLLLEQNAELLYRENATGRTPLELSHDLYTGLKLKDPPSIGEPATSSYYFGYNHANIRCLVDFDLDVFVRDKKDKRSDEEKIWDLCREAALKHPGARRLVSLNEANEVARRVSDLAADSKKDAKAARLATRGYVGSDGEEEGKVEDVIADWLGNAVAWEKLE